MNAGNGNGLANKSTLGLIAAIVSSLGSGAVACIALYVFVGYMEKRDTRDEQGREQLAQALKGLEVAVRDTNSSVRQIGQLSLPQIFGMTKRAAEAQEEVKKAVVEAVKPEGRP